MRDSDHLRTWLLDRYCWFPLGLEQICGVSRTDHAAIFDDEHEFVPFADAFKKYEAAVETERRYKPPVIFNRSTGEWVGNREGVIVNPPTETITGY